jgi:hypothetical protein
LKKVCEKEASKVTIYPQVIEFVHALLPAGELVSKKVCEKERVQGDNIPAGD